VEDIHQHFSSCLYDTIYFPFAWSIYSTMCSWGNEALEEGLFEVPLLGDGGGIMAGMEEEV